MIIITRVRGKAQRDGRLVLFFTVCDPKYSRLSYCKGDIAVYDYTTMAGEEY